MKFSPLSPTSVLTEDLSLDFETAAAFGQLSAGASCLFQRQLLRTNYMPYSAIVHAFLRCEAFTAKMCCGTYPMDQFHLVLVDRTQQEYQLHLDSESDGKALLELIAQRQPTAKIGFYKQSADPSATT